MITEPYRPSNGTDGEIFYETQCAGCARESGGKHCRLIGLAMAYNIGHPGYPKEWVRDADGGWPGNPRCTAFRDPKPYVKPNRIRDKRQVGMAL